MLRVKRIVSRRRAMCRFYADEDYERFRFATRKIRNWNHELKRLGLGGHR